MKIEITEQELETIAKDLQKISIAMCELYFVVDGIRQNYYGGEEPIKKEGKNIGKNPNKN